MGSCSTDSDVGSGLLGDEDLTVEFTDELLLTAKTVLAGPVSTFTRTNFLNTTWLLGSITDPIFGRSTSSFYTQVQIQANNDPDFASAIRVDSLVLTIDYLEGQGYGERDARHLLEIFRVVEPMDIADTIFSDVEYEVNPEPIVSTIISTATLDTIAIFNQATDTTDIFQFIFNIDMGRQLMGELFGGDFYGTPDEFTSVLNGFYFRSTPIGDNSMLALDLSSVARNTRMTLYYVDENEEQATYTYFLNANQSFRPAQFIHDYESSDVIQQIDIPVEDDSPLYLQGLAGTNVELDVGSIRELDDILINYGELEFYLATDLLGDTILYPPANFIGAYYMVNDRIFPVQDLENALRAQRINDFFGGGLDLDENTQLLHYKLNITAHLKSVYKSRIEDSRIFISVLEKSQRPNRSLIFGPGHSTLPAKLNLTYTKP